CGRMVVPERVENRAMGPDARVVAVKARTTMVWPMILPSTRKPRLRRRIDNAFMTSPSELMHRRDISFVPGLFDASTAAAFQVAYEIIHIPVADKKLITMVATAWTSAIPHSGGSAIQLWSMTSS